MTTRIGTAADLVDPARLIELLRGMVRIPSQIPNEGPLAEYLAAEMRRDGLFDQVFLQTVVPGRHNVIGVVRGSGRGPNVVLNGHLDTLMPIGAWTRDPYQPDIEDGYLYGLGLTDMKAGLAAMIEAARAVAQSKVRRQGEIVVTAAMHHGIPGVGSKFFLASWDRPIHAAINGEPTDLKVQVAHGGAWQFELATYGIPVHVSRREQGLDANRKMFHVLAGLDESILSYDPVQVIPGLPRMMVGVVEGGPAPSRTAAKCVARGDIRFGPGMTADTMLADFERYLDRLRAEDPSLVATVVPGAYQRPYRISRDAPLVRTMAAAHREVTGTSVEITDALPASAYVTDSPDFMRAGIPTVVYGPGDWNVVPDERISVAEVVTAAKAYAGAVARIVSGEEGAF